jgi:hypothetical protein
VFGFYLSMNLMASSSLYNDTLDPRIQIAFGRSSDCQMCMKAFAGRFTLNNGKYSQSLSPSPHTMTKGHTIQAID